MRRITRLAVLAPELRPLGAALLGVWACAGRSALGAGGVVLLVGRVCCGPVGRGGHKVHPSCNFRFASTYAACASSPVRNQPMDFVLPDTES